VTAPIDEVGRDLEARVEGLGMELVDLEWAGTRSRPVIRIRIDRLGAGPTSAVTVGDCARVSRELERWLDEHPALPERYVLEVSSPGVERPLRRRRDYERFVGQEVRIKRSASSGSRAGSGVTGVLNAVDDEGDGYLLVLRLPDGSTARVRDQDIARANLVFRFFRWEGGG
jgi:ribosome maturation factor RimP